MPIVQVDIQNSKKPDHRFVVEMTDEVLAEMQEMLRQSDFDPDALCTFPCIASDNSIATSLMFIRKYFRGGLTLDRWPHAPMERDLEAWG